MSVRYIGSKARLINTISPFIGDRKTRDGVFVDLFCGTGVVAEEAVRLGWPVRLNDHLHCAVTMAAARVTASTTARFRKLGGYENAIEYLNNLNPQRGFIWREYSPASKNSVGIERKYFTKNNAARIDAVRSQITLWVRDRVITKAEERLLIADLLAATNRIANIAGTYGCFLSHWTAQSQEQLRLTPRDLWSTTISSECFNNDVTNVPVFPHDLVYLDPPYTKRQYAAYYHILETITVGDEPIVTGITGLRPWRHKASDYCYRTKALRSLVDLVQSLPANRVLLSYSSEGHVSLEQLQEGLAHIGHVTVNEIQKIGRYRPNCAARDAGSAVNEYLILIERSAKAARRVARA